MNSLKSMALSTFTTFIFGLFPLLKMLWQHIFSSKNEWMKKKLKTLFGITLKMKIFTIQPLKQNMKNVAMKIVIAKYWIWKTGLIRPVFLNSLEVAINKRKWYCIYIQYSLTIFLCPTLSQLPMYHSTPYHEPWKVCLFLKNMEYTFGEILQLQHFI